MAETVAAIYTGDVYLLTRQRLARGRGGEKKVLPRSPASRGQPQRPWLATGDQRIDHWEASMDGLGKEKMLVRREQQKLKVGRGKKTPATSWNLVRVRFFTALHRQPEQIQSSLCLSENRGKGIVARGRAGGNSAKGSVDCITVQSLVWTEPIHQTSSVLFELKSMSSN
ncbi:hypothetical protein TIFTF001_022433 [Ficus carica]|uniref:Uncharacterized protein n=1 Tax=Ficus carica TaxID=3494 RepID=A0AA88AEI5_FICCA|nr:hypothetical protein TIFTF001_022433 [Ficus carica]